MQHRFANFASRSASASGFLTEVCGFDDCVLNVGRCPILNDQFLEFLCFGIVNSSVSGEFLRNKLRLKRDLLHLHLIILLTHPITETLSFFILHQSFAIKLVADVVWVSLDHWLDGSQSLRHGLANHQYLTRSINALLLPLRRLLLHHRRFNRSLP